MCTVYRSPDASLTHMVSFNPWKPGGVAVLTSPLSGEGHDLFKITQPAPALPGSPKLLTHICADHNEVGTKDSHPSSFYSGFPCNEERLERGQGRESLFGCPMFGLQEAPGSWWKQGMEWSQLTSASMSCCISWAAERHLHLGVTLLGKIFPPARLGLGALNGQLGELVCFLASAVHWDSQFSWVPCHQPLSDPLLTYRARNQNPKVPWGPRGVSRRGA